MIEREIEYDDIRPGDHVRFERDRDGVHFEVAGIASHKQWDGNWVTPDGGLLSAWDYSTIVLVDRPRKRLPAPGTWVRILDSADLALERDDALFVGCVRNTLAGRAVNTPLALYYEQDVADFEELVLVPRHEYDHLAGGAK